MTKLSSGFHVLTQHPHAYVQHTHTHFLIIINKYIILKIAWSSQTWEHGISHLYRLSTKKMMDSVDMDLEKLEPSDGWQE